MYSFKRYISEGLKLKLIRGKAEDVLKIKDSNQKSWVEVRGKPNFETKYDAKDPLSKNEVISFP